MGDAFAKHPIVVLITTVASLATIVYFATGRNLPDILIWSKQPARPASNRQAGMSVDKRLAAPTWESAVLNAVTERLHASPHGGIIIDSIAVDPGGVATIRAHARQRRALSSFAEAIEDDEVFIHVEPSSVTARPGGTLYDIEVTAFVDFGKLPNLPERPSSELRSMPSASPSNAAADATPRRVSRSLLL